MNRMERKVTLISIAQTTIEPGLRSISSYLKQYGYRVIIIFLKMRFEKTIPQTIIDQILELSSGSLFIGISLMTHEFFIAKCLTRKLKKSADVPVVWGGSHPMVRPEECLRYCDFVCIGEGEITSCELADRLYEKKNCSGVLSIWCKDDNRIIQNPIRPPIKDLDSLPYPDFSFKNHYLLEDNIIKKIISSKDQEEIVTNYYPIFPHRGCPFSCTYCINSFFLKHFGKAYYRKRSTESIISELDGIKNSFTFVNSICFFADDFLAISNKEIVQFKKLYKNKINLPFHINVTPHSVSKEKISTLVEIGLVDVTMGIQSGSLHTLKLYKRFTTKKKILQATQTLSSFHPKITINYDFILDNPWETKDNLLETLDLLIKIPRPYKILLYSLTLYPGTVLYKKAKDENIIRDEITEIYNKSYHTDISNGYINSIFYLYSIFPLSKWLGQFFINKKIMKNPLYFLPYKIIEKSTIILKGLHFLKYIFLAISNNNMNLLKNYLKVALREFRKISWRKNV